MTTERRRASRLILALCLASGCGGNPSDTGTPEASAPQAAPAGTGRATLPPDLAGTSWVLQNVAGRPVLEDMRSTLAFRPNGQIAGLGGCNGYTGTATVTGERITIGPLATTKMACPQPAMEQEARFLDALAKAERFGVAGTNLYLHSTGLEQPLAFIRLSAFKPQAR